MATYQNQNQFAMTPELGQVAQTPNSSVVSVLINPASVATVIQNGSPVKLITGTSNQVMVDVGSDPTNDVIYGVIIYNLRKNQYSPGDNAEVATGGSVMFMETSAAVNRGTTVAINPAGPTVATDTTTGHQVGGVALDQAAAANTLIRVLVKPAKNP
jgi:hypothetical protein